MARFTDGKGREWILELTIGSARRVRSRLEVDVLTSKLRELLQRAFDDPIFLVDVLFVLCEPQAKEREVSDEEFGRAMSADALRGGAYAFVEAVQGFTPDPGLRESLGRFLAEKEFFHEQYMKHASTARDEGFKKMREDAISGKLFQSSRESSESTPAP